eukprot:4524074-Pyramimonas_sp.AAC.2
MSGRRRGPGCPASKERARGRLPGPAGRTTEQMRARSRAAPSRRGFSEGGGWSTIRELSGAHVGACPTRAALRNGPLSSRNSTGRKRLLDLGGGRMRRRELSPGVPGREGGWRGPTSAGPPRPERGNFNRQPTARQLNQSAKRGRQFRPQSNPAERRLG